MKIKDWPFLLLFGIVGVIIETVLIVLIAIIHRHANYWPIILIIGFVAGASLRFFAGDDIEQLGPANKNWDVIVVISWTFIGGVIFGLFWNQCLAGFAAGAVFGLILVIINFLTKGTLIK